MYKNPTLTCNNQCVVQNLMWNSWVPLAWQAVDVHSLCGLQASEVHAVSHHWIHCLLQRQRDQGSGDQGVLGNCKALASVKSVLQSEDDLYGVANFFPKRKITIHGMLRKLNKSVWRREEDRGKETSESKIIHKTALPIRPSNHFRWSNTHTHTHTYTYDQKAHWLCQS